MTKGELLRFLEPFNDDIQIMRVVVDFGRQKAKLVGVQPQYEMGKEDTSKFSDPPIEKGEGYIVMR